MKSLYTLTFRIVCPNNSHNTETGILRFLMKIVIGYYFIVWEVVPLYAIKRGAEESLNYS